MVLIQRRLKLVPNGWEKATKGQVLNIVCREKSLECLWGNNDELFEEKMLKNYCDLKKVLSILFLKGLEKLNRLSS